MRHSEVTRKKLFRDKGINLMNGVGLSALPAPLSLALQLDHHLDGFRFLGAAALLFGKPTDRSSITGSLRGASTYSTRPIAVRLRASSSLKFRMSPAERLAPSATQDFKTIYGIRELLK
jgi:hypothetical protein